jgi:16S rRNA G966 N2-methylase RsmD
MGRPPIRGKAMTHAEHCRRSRRNKTAKAQREAARRDREKADRRAAAAATGVDHGIRCIGIDDVTQEMLPASIDAIITDPPYPEKCLRLFSSLSAFGWRFLKPGGWCVVMTGAIYLPEVLYRLGGHLTYRWQYMVTTPGGANARIGSRGLFQGYKPVVLFQKPPVSKIREWWSDIVTAEVDERWSVIEARVAEQDKSLHPWQQSEKVFAELVNRFSKPGDLVVDPFAGSGTTGRAAISQGRHFWGCDTAPECATEKRKLKEMLE